MFLSIQFYEKYILHYEHKQYTYNVETYIDKNENDSNYFVQLQIMMKVLLYFKFEFMKFQK